MHIKFKHISVREFGLKNCAFLWLSDMVWTQLKGATLKWFLIPVPPAWWEEAMGIWRTGRRISVYLTGLFFFRTQVHAVLYGPEHLVCC